MNFSKSPVVTELEYIEPLCARLRVGQHDDHLARARGERALDGLRHVDLLRPLFGADRVAVQRVDDRVAPRPGFGVARRQKHEHVAVDGITLEVAFKGRAVDLDTFHRDWLCAGHDGRHFGLHLGRRRRRHQGHDCQQRHHTESHLHSHSHRSSLVWDTEPCYCTVNTTTDLAGTVISTTFSFKTAPWNAPG